LSAAAAMPGGYGEICCGTAIEENDGIPVTPAVIRNTLP
jgi:hypothetical protein